MKTYNNKPLKKKVKKHSILNNTFFILLFIFSLLVVFVTVLVAQQKQTFNQHAAAPSISPLLFGTNLTLTDASDQFITSQATRNALQSIHVQLIRMPIRSVGGP